MGSATISVDEFQALEQKVLQTVELIKKEREARIAAESAAASAQAATAEAQAELATLKEKLAAAGDTQTELDHLHRERESVRLRVEKMLANLDELL
jgi:DNA-binding protein H-NS